MLRERILRLAEFVNLQWRGRVRLRVLQAWTLPRGDHRRMRATNAHSYIRYRHDGGSQRTMLKFQDDFHATGRAVDLDLLLPRFHTDDMNLGMLAKLAYYRAHFDWCRLERYKVHCSVKPASKRSSSTFACFPGSAEVQTRSGRIRMAALVPGTEVLALEPSSGRLAFSRVEFFLHREPAPSAAFVRLDTAANRSLTLTASHLLFRLPPSSPAPLEAVFARDVRPGDYLLFAKNVGRAPQAVLVLARREVTLHGFYAPLTALGTVVVDNHVASCFAHVNSHRLAAWAMSPYRLLQHWAGQEDRLEQGVHWYAGFLHSLAMRILPSGLLFPG